MCKIACNKIWATIIIVIALTLAIVVSIWRQEGFVYIVYVSRFFDVMIPVLAVGALLKYLVWGCHCKCHHHEEPCICKEEEKKD